MYLLHTIEQRLKISLNEKLEEQDQLRSSIEASMEQGFMSMVDGTASVKDAFKTMASEIIKELYRGLGC